MKPVLTRLQRDILQRHAGPFLFCFLTIMFLLLMQFLIQFIEHLVGKDIPFMVIIELIATNLAYMVVLAVPMAVLVSSLIAFGKFAENAELAAVKAAGINPLRLIYPVIVVATLFAVVLTWFSNEVLPEANYKARALFIDIRMKKPGFDLRENEFYDGIEGYTFLVREIPLGTDSLLQVTLFQEPTQFRDRAVIKAEKGVLKADEELLLLTLYLYNGSIFRHLSGGGRSGMQFEESQFERYRISFDVSDLAFSRTNPDRRRRDGRTMRAQAMLAVIDSLTVEKTHEISQFLVGSPDLTLRKTVQQDTAPADLTPPNEADATLSAVATPRRAMELDPVPAQFEVLRNIRHLETQASVAHQALLGFRNSLSRFDNMQSSVEWRNERIASFWVEVHKKVSIPFACIIFVMIGAPLGMLTKKGNLGINALIATALFTFYWISLIQGEKLADRLVISPFLGMWFANIVLLVAGIFLMIRISREYMLPKKTFFKT